MNDMILAVNFVLQQRAACDKINGELRNNF
jgi:hypothetical protein